MLTRLTGDLSEFGLIGLRRAPENRPRFGSLLVDDGGDVWRSVAIGFLGSQTESGFDGFVYLG